MVLFLSVLGQPTPVVGGVYTFASEANGLDLILHPLNYNGSQSLLTLEVCIDPETLVPEGAQMTDLEIPVQNNLTIWNQLEATVGNVRRGSENNVGLNEFDFESVALHELGHCIGLAHVNAASESELEGADRNYTKATEGPNEVFDVDPGADGVRGTFDDVRGDDNNLHWFRVDTNDPGQLPLPVPVDASTYDRDESSLPADHMFAQNLDRDAALAMGHPSTFPIQTEAIMQQGAPRDEAQRRLTADGVATLLLAMSGLDETEGTADDYEINLTYGGISSAASCDISLKMTDLEGLALCESGGRFLPSPPGTVHASHTSATMEFGIDFNWFFNQESLSHPEPPLPPQTGDCPHGTFSVSADGTVCSRRAYFSATGRFNTARAADLAEHIDASEPLEPGDVVEIDPQSPGRYRLARGPSSGLVVGVITSTPAITLGEQPTGLAADPRPLLALMGRVPVKATTENGPIRAGDLLVSSSVAGAVMRCSRPDDCGGVLVGKALEALDQGDGLIEVLLMR